MLRHVDLCSGIGGFALGFESIGLSRPVLFCDIDNWCRLVLKKHWPDVPQSSDVKELANDPKRLVPDCDILTAGYPCQPFSLAGKRQGDEDPRHIWPFILRIVTSKRPAWCIFENVYGHISLGLDQVLLDLEAEGYATRTFVVPACSVDAPHKRNRVWIIAKYVGHTSSSGQSRDNRRRAGQEFEDRCQDVPDTNSEGLQGQWEKSSGVSQEQRDLSYSCGWEPEPSVGRVANGIPRRVDRIKGLGNAIVPQIAQRIGWTIKQMEANT